MLRRTRTAVATAIGGALIAVTAIALAPSASAASLVEVTNFGSNPGGMRMHIYVPDTRPANPAIVVAMHGCGGSGPGFYSGSEFASLADRYGYIVIYPSAMQEAGFGRCFDTWSAAAKTRGGGSDPVSIMSMVAYAGRQYGGDQNRVYATGSSSGGMMTQHMLAVYPDVFKAGASFMGVPFNCFANAADYPPGSSQCTGGNMNRTPQQWGDAVRQVNPGYAGPWPRAQLWHGTNDTLVPFSLLQESVEQWTNVHGLSQTATSTDTPQANWNRRRFANSSGTVQVEAYSIQGAGHSLPSSGMAAAAITFFGLTSTNPTTAPTTRPTTPPTTRATTPPTTPPTTRVTTPPTTPPTTRATTPPTTSGSACVATYRIVNQWTGGFQGEVVVRGGPAPITGWLVTFTFPNGQAITQLWGGRHSVSNGVQQIRNETWNGSLNSNTSTTFGFLASWNGSNGVPSTITCSAA